MKKVFALTLATLMIFTAFCGCAKKTESGLDKIKAAGKIVMVTSPDYAPYEFVDLSKTGQDSYVGSDVSLGKYIADKLGVKLEIQAMDFAAVQTAITQGKADIGIANIGYTDERAKTMLLSDFFDLNAGADGQKLLILKKNADTLSTKESFKGKKVAAQNGSLQYNLVTKQLPDAQVELITDINSAVMMVQTGKVDALAINGTVVKGFLANYPDLAISNYAFDYTSAGNVIIMTKGQDALAAEINKMIKEINDKDLYTPWRKDATDLAMKLGWQVNG